MRKRRATRSRGKTRYAMKGCSRNHRHSNKTKCRMCNKIHKKQKGGCGTCVGGSVQHGGNSIGLYQNLSNIGSNFFNGITGIYNGLNAIPQPISVDPWKGHFSGRHHFKY